MTPSPKKYAFGNFELDVAEQTLLLNGKVVPLVDKPFQILCLLVERAGKTITKDDIFTRVWPGTFVAENNLTVAMSNLRDALADDAKAPIFIETIRGRGYRFIANVTITDSVEDVPVGNRQVSSLPPTEPGNEQSSLGQRTQFLSGNHTVFIVACGFAVGLLFATALLLEVSYEFERYGRRALWLSLPTFGFVAAGLIAILIWLEKRTRQEKAGALLFGIVLFTAICVLSWLILVPFLPAISITRADGIQTQPASVAFLKNALIYFWPLVVFFVLIPLSLVVKLEGNVLRRREISLLKTTMFAYMAVGITFWLIALIYSLISTFYLLDRLSNQGGRVYFEQFVWTRFWLWFVLSFACLTWFGGYVVKLIGDQRLEIPVQVDDVDNGLRTRIIASLAISLICAGLASAITLFGRTTPKLDRLEIVTPPTPGQRFFLRLHGKGFQSETVYVVVVGNGCPQIKPCEVPNSALREHSNIFENVLDYVPLTLASGEYLIFAHNGDSAGSNPISLSVP
jgi:DNA-binding winged helix-turn-helix (wHTH) protein